MAMLTTAITIPKSHALQGCPDLSIQNVLFDSSKPSTTVQNGDCYYFCFFNSAPVLVPQIHVLAEMLLLPYALRFVIAIAITVPLMTYVIMPLLTKLLRHWLFKS